MRVALIQCTSSKKSYKCRASELYSESPRFRLAYELAKLVADKILILSAKYGLIPEDMIIEPYNETLLDKSAQERRLWGEKVISELRNVADLEHDEFIIIAGEVYRENLLPHLAHYWLPLKGKRQGEWIPELERLIRLERETDKATVLHMLFNGLQRLDWTMINQIPYQNGIYIMFEKGESFQGMDRIVRVGTHRGQNRLLLRLMQHFINEDADSSIFRKNIGRALLNMAADPYLHVWNIDMHRPENMINRHLVNERLENELETKISYYLRDNITFVCFPVNNGDERLRLEEGIIATLHRHTSFRPSSIWLGWYSPVWEIADSGLWNRHGLNGQPLSDEELERIKQLAYFGNDSSGNTAGARPHTQRTVSRVQTAKKTNSSRGTIADDIRSYIDKKLQEAKERGEDHIDLVSGSINKQMGLGNRNQSVCMIMYEKMLPGDDVIHTTPSGFSSTIKIRYYLKNR
jgi:hypothetical protein